MKTLDTKCWQNVVPTFGGNQEKRCSNFGRKRFKGKVFGYLGMDMREKMLLNKKLLEFDLRYVYQFSDRLDSIKLSVFFLSIS